MKFRQSLEGKFASLAVLLVVFTGLLAGGVADLLDSPLGGACAALILALPLTVYAVRRFMRPVNRLITALDDGVASFQDGDFSVSLNAGRDDELGALVRHYNAAGDVLRAERHDLYQRELMLDTVIQSTPWALVLTNANDRVVYSN